MEEIKIRLTTAEEVREFVRAARKCEFDVDISYGRAVVDGKSIMGIFSLDLDLPLELMADTEDEAAVEEAFREFIC